ncbi:hypothetical protein BJX96DRAFT_161621 [Aspergillus floccosus]
MGRWDAELIPLLPSSVRIMASAGAGYDWADVDIFAQHGIVYCNGAAASSESVADMTLFLILAVFRNLAWSHQAAHSQNPQAFADAHKHSPLTARNPRNHTLGIIGLGQIGYTIARKAFAAFGMNILYHDLIRKSPEQEAAIDARYFSDLSAMLAESDCVVVATPFAGQTLLTADRLRQFKRGARLINIARGSLLDEEALVQALDEGWLSAAGLDVHAAEPYVHPRLARHPRVMMMSHNAGGTVDTHIGFERLAMENIEGFLLRGKALTPSVQTLSQQLHDVFATTGFAYLINAPLSFTPDEVFAMAREFFLLPEDQKMKLAKRSFRPENKNTYRGYFPTQPSKKTDNLKEGFEIGPPHSCSPRTSQPQSQSSSKIVLSEPNVWPDPFPARESLEKLHRELQTLASTLLSLLALSLDKPADFFASYLTNSLSTLRLLHYPIVNDENTHSSAADESDESKVQLSCTPHTDSGILTLLHQDATGGLEVRDGSGQWVAAPYIRGSIVVNIGDLMARVSGGRFVATMHRVRKPRGVVPGDGLGRLSVPFFFEPGEECVVRAVDGDDEGVVYGKHVRAKMSTWVEFMDVEGNM